MKENMLSSGTGRFLSRYKDPVRFVLPITLIVLLILMLYYL